MEAKQEKIITQTAVGELIAALTEEALSFVEDEKEANKLVSYMLIDLFYNSGLISSDF